MDPLPVGVGGGGGSISYSHQLFLNLPQLKIFMTTLMLLILCKNGLQKQWCIILQWVLVNTVTNGPQENGHIYGVVVFNKKM